VEEDNLLKPIMPLVEDKGQQAIMEMESRMLSITIQYLLLRLQQQMLEIDIIETTL